MSVKGIFTGQTSLQAPQSVEAYGSALSRASSSPRNCGPRTAPMGPGYGEP